ncbi:MAG: CPBP family intramembrane glutamic endopeptidase [Thermoanaerobaculia bacterium]|nr:CPBP family intramembrane glutamic endopeptidase [Thermoanaerobaculia bacterium]
MLTAALVTIILAGAFIALNERYHLLTQDHFSSAAVKWIAYGWFALLLFVMSTLVVQSSRTSAVMDMSQVNFWQLFVLHLLLLIFLVVWWFLAGRTRFSKFFNLQGDRLGEQLLIGGLVGVGGWAATIMIALVIGLILTAGGLMPEDMQPSPMIPWMAGLAWWKKSLIVLSAMTVEELFFRGWLQARFGLIASTVIFAISHAGYGQPFMLVGVTVISLVIGLTFYYTRRLLPCIIAHGVFDAIQIFIVIPLALNLVP